jgi:hypothetical protein
MLRRLAVALVAAATLGATAAAAVASCSNEHRIRCPAFTYRVGGHRYRPKAISFALNGRPAPRAARGPYA